MSINNTNPSTLFGGTWEQIAQGRTLVGVDINDNDFNTVKKTGGSKFLQNHNHNQYIIASGSQAGNNFAMAYQYTSLDPILATPNTGTGTGNAGNLQPYFTCYIWLRTA